MGILIEKLCKVINNPKKYIIQNIETLDAMKFFTDGIMKYEQFYNKIIYQKDENSPRNLSPRNLSPRKDSDDKNVGLSPRVDPEVSMANFGNSIANETINMDMYNLNSKLSKFIEGLNIGNFIPLRCGHMGIFSQEELELYQLLLFQANFIS